MRENVKANFLRLREEKCFQFDFIVHSLSGVQSPFIKFIVEQDNRLEVAGSENNFVKLSWNYYHRAIRPHHSISNNADICDEDIICIIFLIIKILEILSRYVIYVRILIKPLLYVRHSIHQITVFYFLNVRGSALRVKQLLLEFGVWIVAFHNLIRGASKIYVKNTHLIQIYSVCIFSERILRLTFQLISFNK